MSHRRIANHRRICGITQRTPNRLEQGLSFERLEQQTRAALSASVLARLRGVVGGDENEWNPDTCRGESLLQLQTGHLRHVNINQHTTRRQAGQSGQELPPRSESLCREPCGAQQPPYGTKKRQVVVYYGDDRLWTAREAAFQTPPCISPG